LAGLAAIQLLLAIGFGAEAQAADDGKAHVIRPTQTFAAASPSFPARARPPRPPWAPSPFRP
jgi:hypothetical protein